MRFQLKPIRSSLGRVAREALAHSQIVCNAGSPKILFLPSGAAEGSNLLRCFNIAAELKKIGFHTVIAHKHLNYKQRSRVYKSFRPDLIFVKDARHPLNRHPFLWGAPYLFDLDDADFYDPSLTSEMEEMARKASAFIAGSRFIARWAEQFNDNVKVVWTGASSVLTERQPHEQRNPLVTWAQSRPLSYPSELAFVEDIIDRVVKKRGSVNLRLYGRPCGASASSLGSLSRPEVCLEWLEAMPYQKFVASLQDAAVGLSPIVEQSKFSRGKSFGKILGYLDAQVPVICSNAADHDLFFNENTGLVSDDPCAWAEKIDFWLNDTDERQKVSDLAFQNFKTRLSTHTAAKIISEQIRDIVQLP